MKTLGPTLARKGQTQATGIWRMLRIHNKKPGEKYDTTLLNRWIFALSFYTTVVNIFVSWIAKCGVKLCVAPGIVTSHQRASLSDAAANNSTGKDNVLVICLFRMAAMCLFEWQEWQSLHSSNNLEFISCRHAQQSQTSTTLQSYN